MKVEVNSQALADAVAWTTRVIDARPATPILAGIRLEAIDGTLQLSAFNYAISARHHIEAGVDEAGSVLVQGKLLADITKSLRSEKTWAARGSGHAPPGCRGRSRGGRGCGVRVLRRWSTAACYSDGCSA